MPAPKKALGHPHRERADGRKSGNNQGAAWLLALANEVGGGFREQVPALYAQSSLPTHTTLPMTATFSSSLEKRKRS